MNSAVRVSYSKTNYEKLNITLLVKFQHQIVHKWNYQAILSYFEIAKSLKTNNIGDWYLNDYIDMKD